LNYVGEIALIVGAYLLGSAPHLLALGRLRGVTLEGDLHQSLWKKGGRVVGGIGIVIDLVKGVIPVLIGKSLSFHLWAIVIAGLAAVVGQMWPVFSRFDGEKGNSIGLAMSVALAPMALFIALIPIVIGAGVRTIPRLLNSRDSVAERLKFGGPPSLSLPVGMALGFLVLPIASWWLKEPFVVTLGFSVMFVLIMLRRLTAGLKGDLKEDSSVGVVLVNRLLYDRSYR